MDRPRKVSPHRRHPTPGAPPLAAPDRIPDRHELDTGMEASPPAPVCRSTRPAQDGLPPLAVQPLQPAAQAQGIAGGRAAAVMLVPDELAPDVYAREIAESMTPGKFLAFSHGFSITFKDDTGVIPPPHVDVALVAPKGSGRSVRTNFLDGSGINASFAIQQDATGRAYERTIALGIAIGAGYLFPTTFKNEVYSDLTGERGVLMGALAGVMEAQYNVLRKNGHSPSEAFNETVEELTQSLIRLVGQNGMDWMYANCSTTAQRGALDWKDRFRDAVAPVFDNLYQSVVTGNEARITLEANSRSDYREQLEKELAVIHDSEMWQAGAAVRSLRPENWKK
jgi:ketol-acid reductoisomerase